MRSRELGSVQIIIIGIAALLIVGVIGFLFWQNVINKKPTAAVNNYAECIKSAGSVQQTSYPEVCVTSDGKRFTNPNQKVADSDKPATKSFCAPIEKLCFDYPSDWSVKSQTVSQESDGIAERFAISDQSGKQWLRLDTGLSGVGGTCGNSDNSYAKILKTHTTKVQGSYLVNEAAKDYMVDTAYAIGWLLYNGTEKSWTIDMELNTSKAVQAVGKLDPCDVGLGVFNGKNARIEGTDNVGASVFRYYTGQDVETTYKTEQEASSALATPEAIQAYAVLLSARYE